MKNRILLVFVVTTSSLFLIFTRLFGNGNDHMEMMAGDSGKHLRFMEGESGIWSMVIWTGLLVLATVVITRLLTATEKKKFAVSISIGGRMKKKQYLISFLLLALTLVLHLAISPKDLALHIIFRFLYLVPIAYVGLKAGKKGGVLTAVITTILYLPHFLFGTASSEFQSGNIVAVFLFYATGFFAGYYRDASKKQYLTQIDETIKKPAVSSSKHILFYVDDKPLSQFASEWFVNFFGDHQGISITLLWISSENVEDILESKEQVDDYLEKQKTVSQDKIRLLENTFLASGYPKENIHTKIVRLESKVRLASIIKEELHNSSYDFVVIPKYKLSRSQEFLFGDTAIQLIREAGYPVLTVASDSLD
ncbi:universal stress protein [bacterium]|nr:universal stress protein [bacterium]